MATKWDLLQDDLVAALDAVHRAQREIEYLENTPCLDSEGQPIKCVVCGTAFQTEADFAKHFVVPDSQYRNLGTCPHAGEDRTLWVLDK
jgi:hypothetical protein